MHSHNLYCLVNFRDSEKIAARPKSGSFGRLSPRPIDFTRLARAHSSDNILIWDSLIDLSAKYS